MRTEKTLIRLGGCPDWSESSLGAHTILLVLSGGGSNLTKYLKWALSWENLCYAVFEQQTRRSPCASVQSDQYRCSSLLKYVSSCGQRRLIRLVEFPGRSESSLCGNAMLLILSCCGSNGVLHKEHLLLAVLLLKMFSFSILEELKARGSTHNDTSMRFAIRLNNFVIEKSEKSIYIFQHGWNAQWDNFCKRRKIQWKVVKYYAAIILINMVRKTPSRTILLTLHSKASCVFGKCACMLYETGHLLDMVPMLMPAHMLLYATYDPVS